jgi:hypothetical protein
MYSTCVVIYSTLSWDLNIRCCLRSSAVKKTCLNSSVIVDNWAVFPFIFSYLKEGTEAVENGVCGTAGLAYILPSTDQRKRNIPLRNEESKVKASHRQRELQIVIYGSVCVYISDDGSFRKGKF